MKFYTNKISTGKGSNFGEFIQKLAEANGNLTKTASTAAPATKEANIANFGDKKANPFGAKKEDGKDEKPAAKKEGEEKEACGTACASTETEIKIAEEKKVDKDGEMHVKKQEMDPVGGTNTGKPEGEKKKEAEVKAETKEAAKTNPKDKKAVDNKATGKKASNEEVPAENKGRTHTPDECCGAPTSGDGSEGSKKDSKKSEPSEKKEDKKASTSRFVKISNLDSKTKSEWKNYWKKLYPSEYVDALFADK